MAGKVNGITLRGLKSECLPFSHITDKLAGAIAKQRKTIAQSGVGFCFPAMVVAHFLPSWAMVCSVLYHGGFFVFTRASIWCRQEKTAKKKASGWT